MYCFDAKDIKNKCVDWIKEWFKQNGNGCNAIIGISGGKDSSVAAALCVEALGRNRVIGVLMPQGYQPDIDDAIKLVNYLKIANIQINIGNAVDSVINRITWGQYSGIDQQPISNQSKTNLPARIRMSTLYAVAQSYNGRVANTCNLSEDWVGYSTRYGDSAGDFGPLMNLTVTEVKAIGRELGLPEELIEKTPADGLCNKTDEENLGFTYEILDEYIKTGMCKEEAVRLKIDDLHYKNKFKLKPMDTFIPYE